MSGRTQKIGGGFHIRGEDADEEEARAETLFLLTATNGGENKVTFGDSSIMAFSAAAVESCKWWT